MFQRVNNRLAVAPASQGSSVTKLSFLHKLLVGDAVYKDNVPVRLSYIQKSFGTNWQTELSEWAKTHINNEEQTHLQRQINRLHLTKYTNRELSEYLDNGGIRNLGANAQAAQIRDALKYLRGKGEEEFRLLINREGKLSNWTKEMCAEFIEKVLHAHRSAQKTKKL